MTDRVRDQIRQDTFFDGLTEAMNDVVNAVSDVASAKHRSVNDVIYELLNRCSDLTSRGPTRNA
jgi:hypothetical protein